MLNAREEPGLFPQALHLTFLYIILGDYLYDDSITFTAYISLSRLS